MNSTKTCSKCSIEKSLNEFYKSKEGKYGRRGDCIECAKKQSKKYDREHREERRKNGRIYYRNHKRIRNEKTREYQKRWYQKHKNEIRQKAGNQSMYEDKTCSLYLGVNLKISLFLTQMFFLVAKQVLIHSLI